MGFNQEPATELHIRAAQARCQVNKAPLGRRRTIQTSLLGRMRSFPLRPAPL